ncbi:hypothetical protein BJY01DRAFT_253303 [Aspergillus pseudoustus]|uniref:Uncharacterized protein n=1 Tax=Aspergillus pseudoustus TaxID=1810923 RepID=A0ABR4J1R6_9EURO
MPHEIPEKAEPAAACATEYTLYLAIHPQPALYSAIWVLVLRPHPPIASSCTWYSSFGGPAQSNSPYHHRIEIKRDFDATTTLSTSTTSSGGGTAPSVSTALIPSSSSSSPYFSSATILGTIQGKDLSTFEDECFYAVDATQTQMFVMKVLYMMALKGLLEVHVVANIWKAVVVGDADVEFDARHQRRYSQGDRVFFAGFGKRIRREAVEGVRELQAFRERLRRDAETVLRELFESFGVVDE